MIETLYFIEIITLIIRCNPVDSNLNYLCVGLYNKFSCAVLVQYILSIVDCLVCLVEAGLITQLRPLISLFIFNTVQYSILLYRLAKILTIVISVCVGLVLLGILIAFIVVMLRQRAQKKLQSERIKATILIGTTEAAVRARTLATYIVLYSSRTLPRDSTRLEHRVACLRLHSDSDLGLRLLRPEFQRCDAHICGDAAEC